MWLPQLTELTWPSFYQFDPQPQSAWLNIFERGTQLQITPRAITITIIV